MRVKINNFIVLVLLLLLNFSCKNSGGYTSVSIDTVEFEDINKPIFKQNERDLILFEKTKYKEKCGSGFTVNSDELSKGDTFLLKKYLYKHLINNGNCNDDNFDKLFETSIFKKAIIFIYDSDNFLKSGIYEDEHRWSETYLNLLLGCKNKNIQKKIIEELLLRNISDGLIVFFDKDIDKLRGIDEYVKKNKNNFYKMCFIWTIYHNTKNDSKQRHIDDLIKNTENFDKESYNRIKERIKSGSKIRYEEYLETLFEGV